jgi:xylulokinase
MLIGLDLGTTAVKALLAEADGTVVARASAPVGLQHLPDGGVEQDLEDIWEAALAALRLLGERGDLAAVKALGVSSQGGALQTKDGDGQPLGPVISWLDARGRAQSHALTDELGPDWFASHIGHGSAGLTIGQVLRLRDEAPDVVAPPNRIGWVGDAIVARLCGRAAHDATSLALGLLYNPWLDSADPELLSRLRLSEDRLPDLLPAMETAGGLLTSVAADTGLPAGIPVSPAVHDQYASALGCGAVHPGDVMFGAGTAWVLLAVTTDLAPPVAPGGFVCRHPVSGLYGQMLSLVNGGSAVSWALRLMGLAEVAGQEIDGLLSGSEAGADGLRFVPLLAPGSRLGPGRMAGLTLSHGRAHVLRAVVEGLACELARHLRMLIESGIPIGRLVMTGGASSSRVTPQIVSDTTGLPVACTAEPDMSALGAAVLARALTEPGQDLAALSEAMSPAVRTFEPSADAVTYAQLLEEYLESLAAPEN